MSDVSSVTTTTGMTGAGGGQKIRITGMETGLDVDALVEKMLIPQQTKINSAQQAEQQLEWKQEAYQDIINDVKELQNKYFDPLNEDTYLLSSNFFSSFDVKSSDSSSLNASAGTGAQAGTYSVSFTGSEGEGQLAQSAVITGTGFSKTVSASTTMSDLGLASDGIIKLNYNGTSEYSIDVKKDDKLEDVINNISKATNGNVTASYSQLTGEFTLKTSETGIDKTLAILSDSSSEVLTSLKLDSTMKGTGQDVLVYITPPGSTQKVKYTNSKNNFTIDGISYNLTQKKDASITVTQNTDKVYDKISKFVDDYNNIIENIQTKLKEKKDYDYKPLTDAQKDEMTDSQIKAWEEKAKKGLLRNDDNLQKLLNDLRSAFTTPVTNNIFAVGKYGSNSIGIDTSSVTEEGGKIEIADKDKLVDAIRYHGDQVIKFFSGTSEETADDEKYQSEGIFTRMKTIFNDNVGLVGTSLNNAILTKYANLQNDYSIYGNSSKNTLPDQIYQQQKMIDKLQDDFKTKQESYYNKFSALETAMTQYNAQQTWLAQQFS